MAIGKISVAFKAKDNFSKFVRKLVLDLWKRNFRMRRFFILDWWRLKLRVKLKDGGLTQNG